MIFNIVQLSVQYLINILEPVKYGILYMHWLFPFICSVKVQ